MTQIASFADNGQRINLFNYFIGLKDKTTPEKRSVLDEPKTEVEKLLLKWLETSKVFKPVKSKTISANKIFLSDRVIVKFELANNYGEHFVLLRGLLEFSRPKEIVISTHNSEKAFEFHIGRNEAEALISYLDFILQSFLKEINFKKALKSVLQFEQTIKQQKVTLYKNLKATLH